MVIYDFFLPQQPSQINLIHLQGYTENEDITTFGGHLSSHLDFRVSPKIPGWRCVQLGSMSTSFSIHKMSLF